MQCSATPNLPDSRGHVSPGRRRKLAESGPAAYGRVRVRSGPRRMASRPFGLMPASMLDQRRGVAHDWRYEPERGSARVRKRAIVRRMWVMLACALRVVGGIAAMRPPQAEPDRTSKPAAAMAAQARTTRIGIWQPPSGLQQVPSWPNGAPSMEGVLRRPQNVLRVENPKTIGGRYSEAIFDVTTPTMTVYPPMGRNIGAAIVAFPGGGFRLVVVTSSGTEICDWMVGSGAFTGKGRSPLPRTSLRSA